MLYMLIIGYDPSIPFEGPMLQPKHAALESELRAKGESFDNGVNGRQRLESFAIINLAADYQLYDAFQVRARIDNLFDSAYEEVLGFGTVGLSGYFGVTITLSR